MYGPTMVISHRGVSISLRAFCKEDIPFLVKGFSTMSILMHTNMLFAQVYENELEWYEKTRKDTTVCSWAIIPEGQDTPIGVTGLHDILSTDGSCTSGIIIWEKDWWGKGIASAAHLGRTLYASDWLCRSTIKSQVRTTNPASYKALQRVGYTIWGTEPVSCWRSGQWFMTHHLKWLHPNRTNFLFPEGLPKKYKKGVQNAKLALSLAREVVIL